LNPCDFRYGLTSGYIGWTVQVIQPIVNIMAAPKSGRNGVEPFLIGFSS